MNERVGAEIVHLTFRRSAPAKRWPYEDIWRALAIVLRLFVKSASWNLIGEAERKRALSVVDLRPTDPTREARVAGFGATVYPSPDYAIGDSSAGTATYPLKQKPPIHGE